jgi:hypothetical protein
VFATGPKKVRWFKPGRDDGLLRAIKILSTHSFGWNVKPEVSCKILLHVKDPVRYFRYSYAKFSLRLFLLLAPDVSAGRTARELWWTS